MKKKFLFLSAFVAATTAFIGCSSDENLAEVPEVIEEPAPEPEAPKGTPFRVVVGNGTTRADLTKTTTANLSNFVLYGIQQTATPNFWMDGLTFVKEDGWGCSDNPTWPVDNKETNTKFYGFSDGVTSGIPTGLTPSIESDAQSFHFTFGEGEESTLYHAAVSEAEGSSTYGASWNTRKANLRESFKSTATVLDNDRLTDLLVTKATEATESDNDGTLRLGFSHALSNLVIKAKFVADETGPNWPAGSVFVIEWLRIYGLYTSGTYTFGSGTPWSFGDSDGKVVYQKNFGEDDDRWTMYAQAYTANEEDITLKTLVDEGEFMVIPQDYSSRAYAGYQVPNAAPAEGQVYIQLYGYFNTAGTIGVTMTDRRNINYFPLNVTAQTFVAGKKQVVVLNLKEVLTKDGGYVATPSQAGGS